MAARDFIISFFADTPQLSRALGKLRSPPLIWSPSVPVPQGRRTGDYHGYVQGLGNSVAGIFAQVRKDRSDTIGRVAVLGFSEGGQGVDAILGCSDAAGIDTVINCDGIHTEYVGQTSIAHPPPIHLIDPAALSKYIAFARLANQTPPSQGAGKMMVLTHSSVKPSYASTTETMATIWTEAMKVAPASVEDAACGWYCPAAEIEGRLSAIKWPNADFPIGTKLGGGVIDASGYTTVRPSAAETNFMPSATFSWWGFADGWSVRRVANGLYVFGWVYPTPNKTKDPTGNRDHVFQAQMVLPSVAAEMLVTRWNGCAPGTGTATNGFGDPVSCATPGGTPFTSENAKPLPDPYAGTVVLPSRARDCRVVPGEIIVGSPGDPCYAGDPGEAAPAGFVKFAGALAGVAAGYFGARYIAGLR
jgi:hypothetical protein